MPADRPDTPLVRVLAAVCRRDGCYLVCRRPRHKRHGGLWEFPGGKLEPHETLFDAAVRELDEELGVRATQVGDVVFSRHDHGSPFLIEFVDVVFTGEPRPLEHEEIRWVAPPALLALDLAPSDRAFAEWLVARSADPS